MNMFMMTPTDVYSEEEKAKLADPQFFKMFRRRLEHNMNVRLSMTLIQLS